MIDGTDVVAVYESAKRAVDRARAGEGPTLIGVDVMRMKGHAEHDDQRYVPKALLDEWRARDPLARYRGWLLAEGVATGTELDEIDGMTHGYAEEEAQLAGLPADARSRRTAAAACGPATSCSCRGSRSSKSPFAEA